MRIKWIMRTSRARSCTNTVRCVRDEGVCGDSPSLTLARIDRSRLCVEEIMSTEDDSIHQETRSFETALTQLLHSVQTTDVNPQGTYTLPAADEDHPAYTVEITVADTADERTQQHYDSYCLHCDWTVSTAEYSRAEVSRRLVDHAVETGHDIESTERPILTETDSTDRPTSEGTSPATPDAERPVNTEERQERQKRA
jgi:predicted small metal-binding protein